MSIYTEAIRASITGPTQYIMRKGLDEILISDVNSVIDHIYDDYSIRAKYHNGAEYVTYRIMDDTQLRIVKKYTKKIIHISNCIEGPISIDFDGPISISFQTFFDEKCCPEGTNADIAFFNKAMDQHERYRIEGPGAEKLKDFLVMMSVSPDIHYKKDEKLRRKI